MTKSMMLKANPVNLDVLHMKFGNQVNAIVLQATIELTDLAKNVQILKFMSPVFKTAEINVPLVYTITIQSVNAQLEVTSLMDTVSFVIRIHHMTLLPKDVKRFVKLINI